MSKKEVDKPRAGGKWTDAQFNTFVRNQLRGATWKWPPISDVMKKARVSHGVYKCATGHDVPVSIVVDGKRTKNIYVDHIQPIVDPTLGFTNWNDFILRLYCEIDNLQILCRECHKKKSDEETLLAKERRKKEKELNEQL